MFGIHIPFAILSKNGQRIVDKHRLCLPVAVLTKIGCTMVAQRHPSRGVLHHDRAFHPNISRLFRTPGRETGNFAKPLNRCIGENCSEVSSNPPQDVGMHSKETKEAAKKGRVEAIYRP